MYSAYIIAVTARKVDPTTTTRLRREDLTTIASNTEITHSEHGFTPSTNPITSVETTRESLPTTTSPNRGTSTVVAFSPVAGAGCVAGARVRSTSAAISSRTVSDHPIQYRSPMIVVGTPVGSKPIRSAVLRSSRRFSLSFQTSYS